METRKYGSVAQIFRLRHGHGAEGRLKMLSQGGLQTAVAGLISGLVYGCLAGPVPGAKVPGASAGEPCPGAVRSPIYENHDPGAFPQPYAQPCGTNCARGAPSGLPCTLRGWPA